MKPKSRLVYWVADCLTDRPAYSIRARTRKACADLRRAEGRYAKNYDTPRKIVVEYVDAFHLVCLAKNEGGFE